MVFFIWDKYEELSVKLDEFDQILMNCSENETIFGCFCGLKDLFSELFESVFIKFSCYQQASKRLSEQVFKSKWKIESYKKLEIKYKKAKLKNKFLSESLSKLSQLQIENLKIVEKSLKTQQNTHMEFSHKYKLKLKQLENELYSLTTEHNSLAPNLTSISSEFQELLYEVLEKNKETQSFSLNYSNSQDFFSSKKSLNDSNFSFQLNDSYDKIPKNCKKIDESANLTSESLMLIKQLLEIKLNDKFKDELEKTTPMSSFYQNSSEGKINVNMPGHRRNKHYLRVQDLEANL